MTIDQEHLVRVRRLLWALLVSATAASLAGNVTHAVDRHAGVAAVGPIIAAALAPAALLGLTHLLGLWSQIQARGWVYWTVVLAIVTLGAAAFRLSFDALRSLAVSYGYGRFDAALFPLILDGLIAVCTLGLVSLTRVTRPVVHREAEAVAQVVHREAELVYPSGLTWMTHPDAASVTYAADRDADHPDAPTTEADTHQLNSDDSVAQTAGADNAAPVTRRGAARETRTRDAPTVPRGNPGEAGDAAAVTHADPVPRRSAVTQIADTAARDAEVLRRAANGASSREIAQAMQLSPSTVQRVIRRVAKEVPAS